MCTPFTQNYFFMPRILLIDDDPVIRSLTSGILRKKGFEVLLAVEGKDGLAMLENQSVDLVITDYQMPGMSGLEVLTALREKYPGLPVILLTAYGDTSLTIQSMQTGAFDYIEKPINSTELIEAVRSGLKISSPLIQEDVFGTPSHQAGDYMVVGKNPAMREIFKNIGRISQNNVNVLITGEQGTGKERIARLIHHSGKHSGETLTFINCKALGDEMTIEEVLPGDRAGEKPREVSVMDKLRKTGSGTVILHEITALATHLQVKLLNMIDQLDYDNGSSKIPKPRLITISNDDPHNLVVSGKLLKELYYKLKVVSIHMPPLRERLDDVPELVNDLLKQLGQNLGKQVDKLEKGVIPLLKSHSWPGNVLELRNVLLQALVLTHGDMLEKKIIILEGADPEGQHPKGSSPHVPSSLSEVERAHIDLVLQYTKWNKQDAAAVLGITRPTLNAKIEKYGLSKH